MTREDRVKVNLSPEEFAEKYNNNIG